MNVTKKKDYGQKVQDGLVRMRVSNVIFNEREWLGMTQSMLAEKAGTTQRIISQIEDGDYNIGLDLLGRILNALELELIIGRNLIRK